MSFNAKDMTQGGQIASMRIRMFSQIANIILYCLFIFFWILVGLVLWVKISWQTFVNGCIYWWCTTLEGMRDLIRSQPVYEIQYYGKTFRMNAAQVLHDKYMIWCGEQLWSAFVLASVVALVICLITFFVVSWILGRQGKQQSENEITGGRQLTDNPKEVARMLKKDGKDSDIRIGDLPIIRDSEIQNFCLHGTVGAGKSEVIRRLANYARQRGDMVVIYDRSGEFVKSYYDPSIDKILNPLDARCAAWDLWKECLTQPDFDNTANTLIPMGTKEDPFWQGSGRTIFAEAAYLMRNDPTWWRSAETMLLLAMWLPFSGTSYGIAGLLMLAVSHRLYRAEDRMERLALVACLLAVIPALNLATSDAAAVAGLVMTVLTVGLVSCTGKSLPRFWYGDFFPTFYACHLTVLGVLAV